MRKNRLAENENYHIYNRGVGKQKIFHDDEDYKRFLKLMYICNNQKRFKFKDLLKLKRNIFDLNRENIIVNVHFYTLMPNHFHICLNSTFPKGGENISNYIKKICIGYTQYYNQKYKRTGTLFEGRFKAEHIDNDNYFKYLFSYVHLNPIKLIQGDWREKGIKNLEKSKVFLEKYGYTSFNDYCSTFPKGGQEKIVNKDGFLKLLPKNINLKKEIFLWLGLNSTFPKGG